MRRAISLVCVGTCIGCASYWSSYFYQYGGHNGSTRATTNVDYPNKWYWKPTTFIRDGMESILPMLYPQYQVTPVKQNLGKKDKIVDRIDDMRLSHDSKLQYQQLPSTLSSLNDANAIYQSDAPTQMTSTYIRNRIKQDELISFIPQPMITISPLFRMDVPPQTRKDLSSQTQTKTNAPPNTKKRLSAQTLTRMDVPQQSMMNAPQQQRMNVPQQRMMNIPQQRMMNIPQQRIMNIPQQPMMNIHQQQMMNIPQQPTSNLVQQIMMDVPLIPMINLPQQQMMDVSQQQMMDVSQHQMMDVSQQQMMDVSQQQMMDVSQQQMMDVPQQSMMEAFQKLMMNAPQQSMMDTSQQPLIDESQKSLLDASQQPLLDALQQPWLDASQPPKLDTLQPPSLDTHQPPTLDTLQPPSLDTLQQPMANVPKQSLPDVSQQASNYILDYNDNSKQQLESTQLPYHLEEKTQSHTENMQPPLVRSNPQKPSQTFFQSKKRERHIDTQDVLIVCDGKCLAPIKTICKCDSLCVEREDCCCENVVSKYASIKKTIPSEAEKYQWNQSTLLLVNGTRDSEWLPKWNSTTNTSDISTSVISGSTILKSIALILGFVFLIVVFFCSCKPKTRRTHQRKYCSSQYSTDSCSFDSPMNLKLDWKI